MREHSILFTADMINAILAGRKTKTRRIINDSFNGCLTMGGPHPCPNEPVVMIPGELVKSPIEGEPDFYITNKEVQAMFFCSTMDKTAKCRYGAAGDILWVRETFVRAGLSEDGESCIEGTQKYYYRADDEWTKMDWHHPDKEGPQDSPQWKPCIHMPKKACRIFLKVKSILVERVQDITDDEAISEGVLTLSEQWVHDNFQEYAKAWRAWDKERLLMAEPQRPPLGPSPRDRFKKLWENINGKDSWDINPWVWVIEFSIDKIIKK